MQNIKSAPSDKQCIQEHTTTNLDQQNHTVGAASTVDLWPLDTTNRLAVGDGGMCGTQDVTLDISCTKKRSHATF